MLRANRLNGSRGVYSCASNFFQIPFLLIAIKFRSLGGDCFVVQVLLVAEMTDGAHGFNQNVLTDPRFLGFSLSDHIDQTLVRIAVLHYHRVSNCTAEEARLYAVRATVRATALVVIPL